MRPARLTSCEISAIQDAYLDGDCLTLAFALHWSCGWPVLAVSERGADSHLHFVAKGPDGLAWDALGPRPLGAAAAAYADDPVWEEVDAHRFIATDDTVDEATITRAIAHAHLLFGDRLAPNVLRTPS